MIQLASTCFRLISPVASFALALALAFASAAGALEFEGESDVKIELEQELLLSECEETLGRKCGICTPLRSTHRISSELRRQVTDNFSIAEHSERNGIGGPLRT